MKVAGIVLAAEEPVAGLGELHPALDIAMGDIGQVGGDDQDLPARA